MFGCIGSELKRAHAIRSAEQANPRSVTCKDAHGDNTGPLVKFGFHGERVSDAQATHIDDGVAVVGGDATAHLRHGTHGREATHDLHGRHGDHFQRQWETAEHVNQLAFISDAYKALGQVGDDFFACQRRPATFDHVALGVDFISAIDVDGQGLYVLGVKHRNAVCAQPLGTLLGA